MPNEARAKREEKPTNNERTTRNKRNEQRANREKTRFFLTVEDLKRPDISLRACVRV